MNHNLVTIGVGFTRQISHRNAESTGSPSGDEGVAEGRRLVQLGFVFAAAYVVFLVAWFWGTRGHRRRVGGVARY
jgi:hypothetical protein